MIRLDCKQGRGICARGGMRKLKVVLFGSTREYFRDGGHRLALRKSSIKIESDTLTGHGVHKSFIFRDPLMVCRNIIID